MRKKIALGLTGIMIMAALGGCGTSKSKYLLDVDYTEYVTLCDYKNAEAEKVAYEISDDEVQERIEEMLYDYATYEDITDRGVESDDYVVIDYSSQLDGKAAEDYSGEGEDIPVGGGYFYEDAEKAMLGMKPGEKKSVDVELTEEFAMEEEDIGKKLKMDITVQSISVENIPEYDQKFVEENTDYKTMKKFEKSVWEEINTEKKDEYEAVAAEAIMQYLLDNSTFNGYPQELYDQCEEYYDMGYESYASMLGMDLDQFMEQMGITEEMKKQEVESSVNYELVVGAIAQLEGIDCSEKEIDTFVKKNCEDFGYDDAEAFFEDYTRQDVGSELIYEKVIDFLLKHAKYTEISEEEYLERMAAEEEALYEEEGMSDEEEVSDEEEASDEEEVSDEEEEELDGEVDLDLNQLDAESENTEEQE